MMWKGNEPPMNIDRPEPRFSSEDLVTAIEQMFSECADRREGMTFREIEQVSGISHRSLRTVFQDLHEAGRLRTAREFRRAIDGSMRKVPVYWLADNEDQGSK